MEQATITDVAPKPTKATIEEEYFSPALQDTSNEVVVSSYASSAPKSRASYQKPHPITSSGVSKTPRLSEEQNKLIKEKILKTDVSDGFKRLNLILGHTIYAAVSKTAKVFGKEVEETDWEPVKKVPKDMIELENHLLRVYFDHNKGIVEAVEVLEKTHEQRKTLSTPAPKKIESKQETVDFSSMTVKDLKNYADENKIEIPSSARKAEIIEILEKSRNKKTNGRRTLPKIPSSDD